jgi:hypothetical protein
MANKFDISELDAHSEIPLELVFDILNLFVLGEEVGPFVFFNRRP